MLTLNLFISDDGFTKALLSEILVCVVCVQQYHNGARLNGIKTCETLDNDMTTSACSKPSEKCKHKGPISRVPTGTFSVPEFFFALAPLVVAYAPQGSPRGLPTERRRARSVDELRAAQKSTTSAGGLSELLYGKSTPGRYAAIVGALLVHRDTTGLAAYKFHSCFERILIAKTRGQIHINNNKPFTNVCHPGSSIWSDLFMIKRVIHD